MQFTQHRLLPYLTRLTEWQQFILIEPQQDCKPSMQPLDAAVQAYLRSHMPHPLFDSPVLIWWNEAQDHALIVPCNLLTKGSHIVVKDVKAFRLVRTKPLAHCNEQAASSS